ncbi:MAG: class I SAM-dependent methyltransferase [Polyangiales bacterium]
MSRSLIAGANAWFRAKESARRGPDRILDDPYAWSLAERDPRVLGVRFARFVVPPIAREIDRLQAAHCIRHRAIDELILRAVEHDGFRQLVIVGAGYDMRAHRFEGRLARTRLVEIDHPDTQRRKLARLEALGLLDDRVARVACDLSIERLATALDRAKIDRALPTLFVLEGLAHYLSRECLQALVDDARIGPEGTPRRMILSTIEPREVARADWRFKALILAVAEIPKTFWSDDALAPMLAAHGFTTFSAWSARDQQRDFAPQSLGRDVRLGQRVVVASGVSARPL